MLHHTRNKHWEKGRFYLLPTLRLCWEQKEKTFDFKANRFTQRIAFSFDFVWLFVKLSIDWSVNRDCLQ